MNTKARHHFKKIKTKVKKWQDGNYKALLRRLNNLKMEYKAFRLCISPKNMLVIEEGDLQFLYTEFTKSLDVDIAYFRNGEVEIRETITNAGIYRTYYARVSSTL